jgi:hypothetical protein
MLCICTDAHLFTSVYMALRCLTLRERNLRRQQNKLAVIKSAEKKTILIQPNSEVVISPLKINNYEV